MVDIPINAVHRRKQYVSSGSAGPYSFSFAILAQGDIAVQVGATLKTLTTHYTVAMNANGTGSVTFTSGNEPASSAIVTLQSNQAIERTTDFTTGGDFRAATVNDELDRLTISIQQLETVQRRTIQLADSANRDVSTSGVGPLEFPLDDTASNNATKTIAFNSGGTGLELGPTSAQISAAATNAATATTKASEASASATASANSATSAAAQAASLTGAASTTSLAIGTGSKAFTIASGLSFQEGDFVLCTSNADETNFMFGQIATYSSTTLTVTVSVTGGSGTKADWTIRRSGVRGAVGSTGSTGPAGDVDDVLTTRGDLVARGASSSSRLPIGSVNTVLTTAGTDPAWTTVSNAMLAGSIDLTSKVTGALPLANGGTGATSLSAANIVATNAQNTFTKSQVPSTSTAALSASSGVLDFDTFTNFILTLASGSNTLAAPTTEASQIGQCGVIIFIQPSSSSAGTLSLHGDYETAGAAGITLSTANSAVDVVPYCVLADNRLLLGAPQLAFG